MKGLKFFELGISQEERKHRSSELLQNLNQESIDVYNFLMDEFHKTNVRYNHLFQFVFRSFYRLDNAGLTPEFFSKYFEIMELNRSNNSVDLRDILNPLYLIKNKKGHNSFQFSFATKLINTIDPNQPIYDSKVSKAIYGVDYVISGDFDKKLEGYTRRYNLIKNTFSEILTNNSYASVFKVFDEAFPENRLNNTKKLDFLFWSYGKLISPKK